MEEFIQWCVENKERLLHVKTIWENGISKCQDCSLETINHFAIKDDLWYRFCEKETYICLACFEKRIGRKVKLDDLKNVPANEILFHFLKQ